MQNKVVKNAAWIIACKIIQSLLGLVVSMLSARYLGPSGYGLINYATSVVAFVAPIMQLGLNGILVQEIVNAPEKEGETVGTALVMCVTSSVFCILGVLSFVAIANHGEKTTLLVCGLYSIILIFQALEMTQYWFQAKLKSKYVSVVALIGYITISIYRIILLIQQASIYWFALSQALDLMIISVSLLIIYKKMGTDKLRFSKEAMKRMFAKSKHYIISNLMVTIFVQTDRIMLKLMLGNEATGFYSAAATCATLTSFVFNAIIDSARPSILESQKVSEEAFEENMKRLYCVIIYLSLAQCLFITLLSPWIVQILYGRDYAPTAQVLRLVVWYTTFAYLGMVRNIWILAKEKQKYLWIINLSGVLMNVTINAVLIPVWGIMGAAFASLFTEIFANVIVSTLIKPIRRNSWLMFTGLNPKHLAGMLRLIKRKK
ncbi:MAG: flippase [Clostridia bacterium]|nr:flippase [Clostridia bacterium]